MPKMKFNVTNRFSGEVQFTAKIECDKDASMSVKLGLAVKWAVKSRAYLSRANLSRAYLSGADLSGANLEGADVYRAYLTGVVWAGSRCPDGTVSTEHDETCCEHYRGMPPDSCSP